MAGVLEDGENTQPKCSDPIQFRCQKVLLFSELNQYRSSISTVSDQDSIRSVRTYLYQTSMNNMSLGCFCRTDTDLIYSLVPDPDQIDSSSDSSRKILLCSEPHSFSYHCWLISPGGQQRCRPLLLYILPPL